MSREYPSKFFPTKIPLNLNKCPLKVGYVHWSPNVINWSKKVESGIECEFISSVIKYTNMSLRLTELSFKRQRSNETILTVGSSDLEV